MTYLHKTLTHQGVVLCADIGGTNFRLAAVSVKGGAFTILHKETHSTPEIQKPETFFAQIRTKWEKDLGVKFVGMGLALAGPVTGQTCTMTNANLSVDGAAIERQLGLPVWLLNDLASITYGIALIDHSDASGIHHLGGPLQGAAGTITRKTVVAPGTGLGVGHLVVKKDVISVLDTESGHIDFAASTDLMVEFQSYMKSRFPVQPGYEQYVSGLAFEYLYGFYKSKFPTADSPAMQELAKADGHYGAIISRNAGTDAHCKVMMELFIDMLARFSSTLALTVLPKSGLYLAGGIPGKNIQWFKADNRFIKGFQYNYLPAISALLGTIPVYLVDDGDIGLYGAAHACLVECSF